MIVSRLYRRFKHLEPEGWLLVAFRRTWLPLFGVVATLALVGFAAETFVPGADSIGDLLRGQ